MHFCKICNNMYYLKLNPIDMNSLIYYCRNCGDEDNNLNTEDNCVLNTQICGGDIDNSRIINKFTKYDVTLPRSSTIRCPNQDCITNIKSRNDDDTKPENEVIYLRYNDDDMKYIYICSHCDTTWKTNYTN